MSRELGPIVITLSVLSGSSRRVQPMDKAAKGNIGLSLLIADSLMEGH